MNEKLQALIAESIKVDPSEVTPELTADECVGWDSLAQVLMISRVMDEFDVQIPFEKITEINCVQDFIDCIEE